MERLFSLPRKKRSFYVYWIETQSVYVGPYGKREYAEKVRHKGHRIVKRKRGVNPNKRKRKRKKR